MTAAFGLAARAEAHRGLRQQPHPGQQRGRRAWSWPARRAFARTSTASSTSSRKTLTPGDDYAHDARSADAALQAADRRGATRAGSSRAGNGHCVRRKTCVGCTTMPAQSPWPDLVLIDGGEGQLTAARAGVYRTRHRQTCRWSRSPRGPTATPAARHFTCPDRASFKLPTRDPVLYFVQRLRDEAHRFAIGSHRQKRRKDIREAGLQEISGIGPTPQARVAAPFRNAEGDRTRFASPILHRSPASMPKRHDGSMISSTNSATDRRIMWLSGVRRSVEGLLRDRRTLLVSWSMDVSHNPTSARHVRWRCRIF